METDQAHPLTIAVIQGPYYPVPPLLNSGAEKVWQGLGREFVRRGCRVQHISRRYPGLPTDETIEGVTHRRLKSRDAPKSKVWYRAFDFVYSWRALRALPDSADIVVTNCIWLPVLMRGRNAKRLYVHVARYPKGQMRLYRHAARLQAVSTAVAQAVERELPEARDRIVTIPPYLSNETSAGDPGPPLQARERRILYLGRVHPEKGVHLLVEAFAGIRLDGWRLEIAGSHETRFGGGGEAYLQRLKVAAGSSGPSVVFSGEIPEVSLNAKYRDASLLVYPSLAERGESFGMVPLEAMACGCPAIVSDLPCFRDYLEPERNGFIFNHRAADPAGTLRAALERILPDEAARDRASRAGYNTSREFTLAKVAGRYLEDFARIAVGNKITPK